MCGGGSRFKERYGMECFVCDWYFACVSAFLRMALALYELSLFRFKDPFSVCVATDIIEKIGMIGKKFRLLPFIFANYNFTLIYLGISGIASSNEKKQI